MRPGLVRLRGGVGAGADQGVIEWMGECAGHWRRGKKPRKEVGSTVGSASP